ncbi:hypothetical protein J7J95_01475, partial [bacterium]|nr:hypothetical protein [bacterium]
MAEENLKEELKKTVEETIEEKIKSILKEEKHKEAETETEKLKEVGAEIKSGLKNLWEKFKFWMLIGAGIFLILLERTCRKIQIPRVKTGLISPPVGLKAILFIEPWFLLACGIYLIGVIWFFISGFGASAIGAKEKKSFSGFLSDILKIVIWSGITIGLGGIFLKWFQEVIPTNLSWLVYPIGICWLILGFRATIEILEGDETLKISLMMLSVGCGLFLVFLSFAQTRSDWNWQVLFTKQNLGFWISLTFLFLIWYILKGTYQWTSKALLILFPVLLLLILNEGGYKTIKPRTIPMRTRQVVKPKIQSIVVPKLEFGMRRPFFIKVKPREKIKLIFYPNPQWIWDGKSGYEVFIGNRKIYEIKKIESKKTWNFKNSYSR